MTIERAIEILNPEHREHYDSIETVNEACRMGMEALRRTRWIPVAERPPENKRLLCTDGKAVFVAMLTFGGWVLSGWHLCSPPTHWMLLPEPPGVG